MNFLYIAPKNYNVSSRVIVAIAQDESTQTKKLSVLRQNYQLPVGYASVECFPSERGVLFREAGTSWPVAELGCSFDDAEFIWSDLLALISEAYVMGLEAGRASPKKHSLW